MTTPLLARADDRELGEYTILTSFNCGIAQAGWTEGPNLSNPIDRSGRVHPRMTAVLQAPHEIFAALVRGTARQPRRKRELRSFHP